MMRGELNMEEENKEVETVEKAVETPPKTYTESEYNALKTQLESLQKSTKDNEDFKAKWEQSEQARKEFEYQTNMEKYIKSLGLVDDVYEEKLSKLLQDGGAVFKKGDIENAEDTLEKFKKKYPQAFKSSKIPRFTDDTQGKPIPDDSTLRKIMGLKPKN
jgi:hypothetical protein